MNEKINCVKMNKELIDKVQLFDSGNPYIDNFLKSKDSLDNNIGKTYLLLFEESVLGYFNISSGCIDYIDELQRVKMGGAIHINYLALDKRYHHSKINDANNENYYISDILLDYCISVIEHIHKDHLGFAFITLSATNEGLKLYERNGFERLDSDMKFSNCSDENKCIDMYYNLAINEY